MLLPGVPVSRMLHRKMRHIMTVFLQEPAEIEEVTLGPTPDIEELIYLEYLHLAPITGRR
jgi:hypothetical protein